MKRATFFRGLATLLAFVACGSGFLPVPVAAQPAAAPPSGTLTVMSYNLRFASPTPPDAWPDRRPLMRHLLIEQAPDVIGTQEGIYSQLKDLAADLPAYDWIGLGRDGGSKGELMAVFYRKARLEPLAFDHFWLSDTPETMGSKTWGTRHARMVTWVKFQDRETGRSFFIVNTHFDHQVQEAREKAAKLMRERVTGFDPALAVIVTGDFNAPGGKGKNKCYDMLTDDGFFADTWNTAKERHGDGLNTFNGFKAVGREGIRIDWILTRGAVATDRIEIVTYSRDGKFPSDHCPVVAKLRLGAGK